MKPTREKIDAWYEAWHITAKEKYSGSFGAGLAFAIGKEVAAKLCYAANTPERPADPAAALAQIKEQP